MNEFIKYIVEEIIGNKKTIIREINGIKNIATVSINIGYKGPLVILKSFLINNLKLMKAIKYLKTASLITK